MNDRLQNHGSKKSLHLENLRSNHAKMLYKEFSDSRIYERIPLSPPSSPEELEIRFSKLEAGAPPDRNEEWLNWLVFDETLKRYVCWVQATISGSIADLSYVVFPDFWKMGYGFQSVMLMIEYLEFHFALCKIRATMSTGNAASITLAEKIGMKRVRKIEEGDPLPNGYSSEYVYEIFLKRH